MSPPSPKRSKVETGTKSSQIKTSLSESSSDESENLEIDEGEEVSAVPF